MTRNRTAGNALKAGIVFAVLVALVTVVAPDGDSAARDKTILSGPVRARVLRVVDGDTLVVRARIWLGQDVRTLVRLSGVDAPEMRGRCEAERIMARRARSWLRALVGDGEVVLTEIHLGKYAGRVVARVATPSGGNVADMIRRAGLARPYLGGRRESWCRRADGAAPRRR